MRNSSKGFTLIEILITIAIISIVFGVVVTSAIQLQKSGRDAKRKSDLRTIQSALQQYYTDNFNYPMSNGASPLVLSPGGTFSGSGKTYLNSIPKDPNNATPYLYKALNSSNLDCDNTPAANNPCVKYCLYAYLEFLTGEIPSICSPAPSIPSPPLQYNYAITLP